MTSAPSATSEPALVSNRLQGRVAVVTGGGNGIGRATAIRFAAEGAAVVVADLQADGTAETVTIIEAAGGRAVGCRLDASSTADNHAMADLAVSTYGRLDVLLTAAGISHGEYRSGDLESDIKMVMAAAEKAETPGRAFLELERDNWQKVLDVNLTGTLLAMQACAAKMIDAGNGGSIITIASIAAKNPDTGPLAYTVSKAGVWMLTKKAARELALAKIRVNSIGPGYIETNMTKLIDFIPDRGAQLDAGIPMGRRGKPEEVAAVAAFLASDDASYMTGTILHPDGGFFTD
jgi:NAD(P)-dependent dehydrogenase (short-subunit alcohol dehydrogenase family)